MKYKRFLSSTRKNYQGVFMHQMVSDIEGNPIPVTVVPPRFTSPLIYMFLTENPDGDVEDWMCYVIYMCIPDATELTQLYDAEHGDGDGSKWMNDMYGKILLINPLLSYKSIVDHQTPIKDDKVIYVNFTTHKKYGAKQ